MDTIHTSTESGVFRVRLNVRTGMSAEVAAFFSDRWINSF